MVARRKWALCCRFQDRSATGFVRGTLNCQPKLFWTTKPQRTVGPHGVVVDAPRFNPAPGLGEIDEPLFIQARIPEFAIEALHQGVLTRLPRLDKPEPDPRALRPEEEGLASELWPVIQHNGLGPAPLESQVIQKPADAFPGNRHVHELADAFPAVIVHDVQNAQTPTRGSLIRHEIHRPALVQALQTRERHPVAGREAFAPLAPDLQVLFSIQSVRLFGVHDQALPFQ